VGWCLGSCVAGEGCVCRGGGRAACSHEWLCRALSSPVGKNRGLCLARSAGWQRQRRMSFPVKDKLKHRKFHLNMRKNFITLRVTEPWHRLPREAVESPSLEIFKTLLGKVLCSLLWVTLLRQGVGLGDPQRSFPTPTML